MIFMPLVTGWGFNTGVKAGQAAGGVVAEEATTLVDNAVTGLKKIGSNFLITAVLVIVGLLIVMKIINRVTS